MMGYMLAPRGGSSYIHSQPLYRPSDSPNSYYTGSNGRVGSISANGRTQVAQSQAKRPPARTRTVSRGGFGARAARSSGGGFRGGCTYGNTDDYGHEAVEDVVNHFDYHATQLHLFGVDSQRLHFEQGKQKRTLLDGRPGRILKEILG